MWRLGHFLYLCLCIYLCLCLCRCLCLCLCLCGLRRTGPEDNVGWGPQPLRWGPGGVRRQLRGGRGESCRYDHLPPHALRCEVLTQGGIMMLAGAEEGGEGEGGGAAAAGVDLEGGAAAESGEQGARTEEPRPAAVTVAVEN
eukprot:3779166-Rhodomonas_salina.1